MSGVSVVTTVNEESPLSRVRISITCEIVRAEGISKTVNLLVVYIPTLNLWSRALSSDRKNETAEISFL